MTTDPWMTAQEIGDDLRVSRQTALNWMKRGQISAFRDGHVYRARRSAVDAFIKASTTRRSA